MGPNFFLKISRKPTKIQKKCNLTPYQVSNIKNIIAKKILLKNYPIIVMSQKLCLKTYKNNNQAFSANKLSSRLFRAQFLKLFIFWQRQYCWFWPCRQKLCIFSENQKNGGLGGQYGIFTEHKYVASKALSTSVRLAKSYSVQIDHKECPIL